MEERGPAAGLAPAPALPLPACCQMSQPIMKSRDQEWWWVALYPVKGNGSSWRSKSIFLQKSITPPPPSCSTAQPHCLHLHVGKMRLGEECKGDLACFLHIQLLLKNFRCQICLCLFTRGQEGQMGHGSKILCPSMSVVWNGAWSTVPKVLRWSCKACPSPFTGPLVSHIRDVKKLNLQP